MRLAKVSNCVIEAAAVLTRYIIKFELKRLPKIIDNIEARDSEDKEKLAAYSTKPTTVEDHLRNDHKFVDILFLT